jgi:hypothetical protein
MFEDVIMKESLHNNHAPTHRHAIKIIDSSTVALCLQKYKWAPFRKTKVCVKLHMRLVFFGKHDVIPDKATITAAKKNDRTQLDELMEESGVT